MLVEQGAMTQVDATTLLANDIDPQGESLSLTGVDALSAAGFPVGFAQRLITYRPSATFVGPDSFTYSVMSPSGAIAQGRVEILVYSGEIPEKGRLVIKPAGDSLLLRFHDAPGRECVLQQSLELMSWSDQQQIVIPAHGLWEYSVGKPAENARYYRVVRK